MKTGPEAHRSFRWQGAGDNLIQRRRRSWVAASGCTGSSRERALYILVSEGQMGELKRVVVIANKWWECEPLMFVLLHNNARPHATLGWPSQLNHPRPRPDQTKLP